MTTIDPTPSTIGPDRPDRTAGPDRSGMLGALRPAARLTPVDPDHPVLPDHLRDRTALAQTVRLSARRTGYRLKRLAVRGPAVLLLLLVYTPRGLGRLVATIGKWAYDSDTAVLRHEHAGRGETAEATKVQSMRRANLHARWLVGGTLLAVVVGPVLAWTAPGVLATIVGAMTTLWLIKIIPGRHPAEIPASIGVGVVVWYFLPALLVHFPRPPWWSVVLFLTAAVLAVGWHGRPEGKGVGKAGQFALPGALQAPKPELVTDALVASVQGISEKTRGEIRWHAPGVARARNGYHLAGELVPGVTAADVVEARESFAAALRRPMGCVWPSVGPMHPGHLVLFIGDQPMATAEQSPWPLASGKRVDIFEALPLFTDQHGAWFDQRLAYNAVVIGGAPGFGKSFALRELGCAAALDPRTKIKCYDGKGNGDLRPLRLIADEFHEGDEPEDVATQLRSLQAIREEMRRRARFLRDLPASENPEDKVTSALVDRYPHLAPVVALVDELQVYTEHEDKETREAFGTVLADLVRRGRSAGIILIFATQKPDAKAIPTAITDNCSVRLAFRVNGQRANDCILGTEMHSRGVRATKFGPDDRGLAWLKGDGAEPLVVRTVHGFDKPTAEKLMAKARALRESLGLLTGYSAGEAAEAEDDQVRLLDDAREVLDAEGADRMHVETLLDRLALLRPGIYGPLDVAGLGAALRRAGVPTGQVKIGTRNTTGVRRAALDIAATSDEDPDNGDPGLSSVGS
ncbi:MAG: FtsK/SpoIIIE domain-containing protein [Dehalococcoidia bacterium]